MSGTLRVVVVLIREQEPESHYADLWMLLNSGSATSATWRELERAKYLRTGRSAAQALPYPAATGQRLNAASALRRVSTLVESLDPLILQLIAARMA